MMHSPSLGARGASELLLFKDRRKGLTQRRTTCYSRRCALVQAYSADSKAPRRTSDASAAATDSGPGSPGRGNTHVVAVSAATMDWFEEVRANGVVAAAREAEEAAKAKAARLQAAQRAAYAAAAESERLKQQLSSNGGGGGGGAAPVFGNRGVASGGAGSMALSMPAPPDVVPSAHTKAFGSVLASNGAMAAQAGLSPPVVSKSSAVLASSAALAAHAGLSPPAVSKSSAVLARSAALAAHAGLSPPAVSKSSAAAVTATTADLAGASAVPAEGGASTADWSGGMQLVSAIVGCAAVGTVMWSEFVLKETGCGLPPGPYGLLGAAEGISYLAVLGFAGAGVAARSSSSGKQGLPGALAVPEVLAYGALAAGLMVLASQLQQYGYIQPSLPEGQYYPDAAVAVPAADELSAQLAAQLAALQGLLSQLQSAAADGIDQLQLQQQLESLQQQTDAFSAYVATQASAVDVQLQSGLLQLQDSLTTASSAVTAFVDTQLQQLDIPGKLAYVVDVLRRQEQQLVVELPKAFAELQNLAATATAVVQETALQAANGIHLEELLLSLDKSMGVLHDVLELRIQQLDVVLTQLHDSCTAAAAQLAAAAAAAQQAGSSEAAAQLATLQGMLSSTMSSVQQQVWAGYQQLALADHLSDMLLAVRCSTSEAAASATAEVEKLQLQQQLQELEAVAETTVTALSANAMDKLEALHLEQRLAEIEAQATAAAASLQAGLVQQYQQQLPVLQQQLDTLQGNLAGMASGAKAGRHDQAPQVELLLQQLQQSMEATVKVISEVASSSADVAGSKLQAANVSLVQFANSGIADGTAAVADSLPVASSAVPAVQDAGFVVASAAAVADTAVPVLEVAVAAVPVEFMETVVDVLRRQEQQLVVELPKAFAELQNLAATATAVVQETALQAANGIHLEELLLSLDKSMGVLHDVLELRIQQLDVVLTQLHDSCTAAAAQLAAAAAAAQQAGSSEAAAQLATLQGMLSSTMSSVQQQVWAGYQQLALADHLSDMLLTIRSSASEVAASATAEVEKLQLQQQLQELEEVAETTVTVLSANAMDKLEDLHLEQRLAEIEAQATAAAASLQAGLVQQYQQQLPVLQQQLDTLQGSLAGMASGAKAGMHDQAPQVELLLRQLQQSMEATVKVISEVASSSADVAGSKLQAANVSLVQYANSGIADGTAAVADSLPVASSAVTAVQDAGFVVAPAAAVADTAVPVLEVAVAPVPVEFMEPAAAAAPAVFAVVPEVEAVQAANAHISGSFKLDFSDAPEAVKAIWANRPQ